MMTFCVECCGFIDPYMVVKCKVCTLCFHPTCAEIHPNARLRIKWPCPKTDIDLERGDSPPAQFNLPGFPPMRSTLGPWRSRMPLRPTPLTPRLRAAILRPRVPHAFGQPWPSMPWWSSTSMTFMPRQMMSLPYMPQQYIRQSYMPRSYMSQSYMLQSCVPQRSMPRSSWPMSPMLRASPTLRASTPLEDEDDELLSTEE